MVQIKSSNKEYWHKISIRYEKFSMRNKIDKLQSFKQMP